MKLLVDNCLSPKLAKRLAAEGYSALHVSEVGLRNATDSEIFDRAERENEVIITADSDFGKILFTRDLEKPSVILFRKGTFERTDAQLEVLLENFSILKDALMTGSVVVCDLDRIRIRPTKATS